MTEHQAPIRRTRDAAQTRHDILRAAQLLFSQRGYSATGVRDVSDKAGVSFALVRRYFGSKLGLLRAALEDMLRVEPLLEGDRADFGRRAVDLFISAEPETLPVAMMLLASADPEARDLCRDILQERILEPLAEWLGGPEGVDRAARLQLLWTGFIAARQILSLERLSRQHLEPTREWLVDLSQAIAEGAELPVAVA